jgi:aspartate carbamoyltransferase catalytic subunit
MPVGHLVSLDNLTDQDVSTLFDRADVFDRVRRRATDRMHGQLMAVLFYEPSTRTRLSFETAFMRLGGSTMGFSDIRSSSVSKGETLADTIRIVASYVDAIVIRHPAEGSAQVCADLSSVPIVSGGDGSHLHPTQTLTDLYYLRRTKGRLEGLTVALCGDLLAGRTVHSLATALVRFGARVVCVAPSKLGMPPYVLDEIHQRYGGTVSYVDRLQDCLSEADIIYMTRLQRERLPAELAGIEIPRIDQAMLDLMRPDTLILHPLPRVDEISHEVDADPRAGYFDQAACGVFVRMALLDLLLEQESFCCAERPFRPVERPEGWANCANASCITVQEPTVPQRPVVADWSPEMPRCAYCEHELDQGLLPFLGPSA